jgi:hypothetical protein
VRRLGILLLLCCARPVAALAQDSTSVVLQQARDLYESLELERAVPLLRQILSPGWTSAITTRQRVDANLYLGAALSLLGNQDSARAHFRTALERDPFSDLDPSRFTPAQIQVFQEARRTVFAVAVRPLVPLTLDPQSGRVTFAIVATHDAAVRCDLRSGGAGAATFTLFAGDLQGGTLREIDWNGLLAGGQLAPAGRYAFVVLGESRLPAGEPGGRRDSAVAFFDVQQDAPALEDTLAELSARELLPERYPSSAATGDVLKGMGVAAGAFFVAGVVSNGKLGRNAAMPAATAGVGLSLGIASFLSKRGRDLPANVAANARRRSERAATNAQIRSRNAQRLAQTVLRITPAAGAGP